MTENEKNLDTLKDNNTSEDFYAGANRGEVLLQMTEALEQGVALLVLTGEEGSGKTMICRLLEREASKFCFTVFLTKSVESFEDVVKKIGMWLGLTAEPGYEGKNVDRMLDNITDHLIRESTGLLIIFDEADNIYLATLERIRKMLDRVTQAGARMHIVFSGRKTFLNNYQQLSICDFKNSRQLEFDLAPLSEQETGEYLHAYAMDAENRRVFNDEIVRNIYSLAQGNFRKTNLLAEESLRTHGDDTSFMVLLENVKEEEGVKQGRKRRATPLLKRSAHYLPWVGGLGCIVLLLVFMFGPGGGNQSDEKVEVPGQKVESVVVAEGPSQEKKSEAIPEVGTPSQSTARAEEDALSGDSATVEVKAPEVLSGGTKTEKISGVVEEDVENREETSVAASVTTENKVVPRPAQVQSSPLQTVKVAQLRQEKPLKVKKILATDKGSKGTINAQPPAMKENSKNQLSVDQLLQKRIAAGSAWTKKGKEDAYTMQLMALTDKNAEENLKKMLAQPQYRRESGNFFIFKKPADSTVVFVFYGEYPNLTMAREAQENLPPFLLIHQPYAISIKGALAKVKR